MTESRQRYMVSPFIRLTIRFHDPAFFQKLTDSPRGDRFAHQASKMRVLKVLEKRIQQNRLEPAKITAIFRFLQRNEIRQHELLQLENHLKNN